MMKFLATYLLKLERHREIRGKGRSSSLGPFATFLAISEEVSNRGILGWE